jgi:uncharacterized membrane protein YccC
MSRRSLRRIFASQRPHLIVALRGTAAALTALAAAQFLGLACPYWAAMTAIIVIQPTRGLLFEKSLYRLVGTVIGSSAGLLLLLSTRSPLLLTLALCLWVAGCVGIGNLLYGLRSYASLMAGCTCVVIAMSGYQDPAHLYDIAFGRVAGIIVGIICATLVTALFTPRQPRAELINRLERVAAECVAWLAQLFHERRGNHLVRREQEILIEISEIETLLDVVAAGSLRFKPQARQVRRLITALLSLLAVGRFAGEQLARHHRPDGRQEPWRALLALNLDRLAGNLADSATDKVTADLGAIAAEAQARFPLLGGTLADLVVSLNTVVAEAGALIDAVDREPTHRFLRHRDWSEAGRAAIRAVIALAVVGLTWSLAGWTQGPLMLMATSIMITIFSTKEHPVHFVGNIFLGAATGSAVAVFCRSVLLSGVTVPYLADAIIAPLLFLGIFAMTQRRTAIPATDATLFFIFVTQPGTTVSVSPYDLVLGAIAMVLGVGNALVAYRYLVPINPAIRLRSLLKAIMRDLEGLATTGDSRVVGQLQTRMQHRVMRMVAMATRYDADHLTQVEGGISALAIAKGIQRLRELVASGDFAGGCTGIVGSAISSLSDLSTRPGNAAQVLEDGAKTLYEILDPGFSALPAGGVENRPDAAPFFGGSTPCWDGRSV